MVKWKFFFKILTKGVWSLLNGDEISTRMRYVALFKTLEIVLWNGVSRTI